MRYLLLAILFVPSMALSRPVSYADGWMVMQENDYNNNSLELNYSPSFEYAIGARFNYESEDEIKYYSMRYNRLLKRWNMEDAQANIFLKTGLGVAEDAQDDVRPAYDIALEADYETRRIYTYYELGYDEYGDTDKFWQKTRLGFAPYIAGYKDLNTWFIMQVEHVPEDEGAELVYTPLARMYYENYLWEVGYSSEDEIKFSWEITF